MVVKATEGGLWVPGVQQVFCCVFWSFLVFPFWALVDASEEAGFLPVCLSDRGARALDPEELRVGQGVR